MDDEDDDEASVGSSLISRRDAAGRGGAQRSSTAGKAHLNSAAGAMKGRGAQSGVVGNRSPYSAQSRLTPRNVFGAPIPAGVGGSSSNGMRGALALPTSLSLSATVSSSLGIVSVIEARYFTEAVTNLSVLSYVY